MERPRILVVDDDAELLESLSLRLRREGFDVAVAMDGCKGLQRARREAPDLLILDIHIPAGEGFSIQERLQDMPGPWPPVIYLTGDRSMRAEVGIKRLGAFAIVYKPYDFSKLLAMVKRAIGAPHAA
ncbi:hypothetical protein LCGC14_2566680 [marine sediment metagenome]|uniref:Response regulatory domain-containing protein n=1 Tax=marine sediment metagenome TaxID=412755 RepID=A0A0F9AIF3_9ZZZZ